MDLESRDEDVAEERVRPVLPPRRRTAAEPPHRLGDLGQPAIELTHQSRLADAGVADDRDDPVGLLVLDVTEQVLQLVQLPVPPDRARLDALHAARCVEAEAARPLVQHDVAVDRLGDALQLQSRQRLERERTAHVAVRVGRDQHTVRRRGGLQAAGPVDRLADHGEVLSRAFVESPDHDVAGVDAHPHGERHAVARAELGVQRIERVAHRQRGSDGEVGILLARATQPEHGHDGIADELLDHAAVGLDQRVPSCEVLVDERADVFRVERPRQHGEVDEVGEQHRDELALLALEPGLQLSSSLAQRGQRRRDHRLAERGALGLDGRDRRVDRVELARPARRPRPGRSARAPPVERPFRPTGPRSRPKITDARRASQMDRGATPFDLRPRPRSPRSGRLAPCRRRASGGSRGRPSSSCSS